MNRPDVSVVVVSLNTSDYLARFLTAIPNAADILTVEVIVVDNGSSDGTQAMLAAEFPQVRVIQNQENLGFGRASNVGARASRGRLLLLLNSDCELEPGALATMVDTLEQDTSLGGVLCGLVNADGSLQPSVHRSFPSPWSLLGDLLFLSSLRYAVYRSPALHAWLLRPTIRAHQEVHDVAWGGSACLLLRRDIFEAVGGFDEGFFMYCEDMDLCKRIRDAGYRVRYLPGPAALHHWGKSTAQLPAAMLREAYRSRVYYFEKHFPGWGGSVARWVALRELGIRRLVFSLLAFFPWRHRQSFRKRAAASAASVEALRGGLEVVIHAIRVGVDGRELAGGVRTGIGRYLMEVLRAASRVGWECVVYGDRATRLECPLAGVNLRVLTGRWTQWWDQVILPRQLARDGIAVFLSPYYKGPLLAPCPVVLTIHDLFFINYLGQRRPASDAARIWLARLYALRAVAIITDSEYSKQAVVGRLGVSPAKVTVIPVALGAEFKPAPLTDATGFRYGIIPPYIMYVGNFKPHKNLPCLLRAYAKLPTPLRVTHELVLAGGDRDHRPALVGLARALGVADRVIFPGQIEDRDLPAVYSACALFLLLSLEEGFGLPALEAMACGAPVVASNRGALPEVVGEAALLVDPEDETAITAAMVQVLSEAEVRERLRRRGLARAREFSLDRTAGRVLALLRAVIEAR